MRRAAGQTVLPFPFSGCAMLWLKLLGQVINALNKGAAPWQVAGGLVMGVALGLIPGWPIQAFLLLLIMFVINVNLTIAGVGAVVASATAWLIDPLVDRVGALMLEDIGPLRGLWTQLYNWPPMGLTRFNNTVVMGATVVGVVGAIVWFPILLWAVRVYRARFLVWAEKLWIMRVIKGSSWFHWVQRISSLGFSR
jgi:uncharacterized protein (TIGR03546 family)